ncbi:MAG TPA: hypothetical protein VGZ00_07945 [Candidatus Baltobacteraceae bacterium]|jgi:hypothetical protein|nr:hypothetical protein [Candidatus Baltobacteraceae bacterium]
MKVGIPMAEVGLSNKGSVEAISSEDAAKLGPALVSFLGMGATAILAVAAAQTLDMSDDKTQLGVIITQSSALVQLGMVTELFLATRSLLDDMKQCFRSNPNGNDTSQQTLSEQRVMDLSGQAYAILADMFFSPSTREEFEIEIQHRACVEPVRKNRKLDPQCDEYFCLEPSCERMQRETDEFIFSFKDEFNTNSEGNSQENVEEMWDAALWEKFQCLMTNAITEIFSDDFSVEGWLHKRERDLSNNQIHIQFKISTAVKATDSMEQKEIFQMLLDEGHENWDFSTSEVRRRIKTLLDVGSKLKRERHTQLHIEQSEPLTLKRIS